MKKLLVLLFLMAIVSVSASARKSYIVVQADKTYRTDYIRLSGDVPKSIIESAEDFSDYHYWRFSDKALAEMFNLLSEYGYEVESVISTDTYLLSKEIPSNQTQIEGDLNKDGAVNISDINKLVSIILGYVKEHPEILEQIK